MMNNYLKLPYHSKIAFYESKCVAANGGINDEKTEVRMIQKWNGYRPHIRSLLGSQYAYLVGQKQKNKKIDGSE
jgi:hypothetical protein